MLVEDFNFDLPSHLVAHAPCDKRDQSALMFVNRQNKTLQHHSFFELPLLLQENDVLVVNNSKVFNARLYGKKISGALIECLLLEEEFLGVWRCLCKPAKRLKIGDTLIFSQTFLATVQSKEEQFVYLKLQYEGDLYQRLEEVGEPPLPPYISVDNAKNFSDRYQTVYANNSMRGSVAAPTAGLHFTPELLLALKNKGIAIEEVTLHVGYGTFKPVTATRIEDHDIHEESFSITEDCALRLLAYKKQGRRLIAVGTTTVRVLETAFNGNTFQTGLQRSKIFIYPGYQFKCVEGLITNFHLPQSTLLMLVSAFAGREFVMAAYREAIKKQYRFYSFGDAMLIL
jgi:S-adenosylmethionine:tRNA ribosyltransferase-isomerase